MWHSREPINIQFFRCIHDFHFKFRITFAILHKYSLWNGQNIAVCARAHSTIVLIISMISDAYSVRMCNCISFMHSKYYLKWISCIANIRIPIPNQHIHNCNLHGTWTRFEKCVRTAFSAFVLVVELFIQLESNIFSIVRMRCVQHLKIDDKSNHSYNHNIHYAMIQPMHIYRLLI